MFRKKNNPPKSKKIPPLKVHRSFKPHLENAKPTIESLTNLANQIRFFIKPIDPNHKMALVLEKIAKSNRDHHDGRKILKKGKILVRGTEIYYLKDGKKTRKVTPKDGCHQLSLAFYEVLKHIERTKNINLNPRISRITHYPAAVHSTVLFDLNGHTYEANLLTNHKEPKIKVISKEEAKSRRIVPAKIITTEEYALELNEAGMDFLGIGA